MSGKRIAMGVAAGVLVLAWTARSAVMNILAVGTTVYSEVIDGPATLTFRQLLMEPNEVSGWHYHPGTLKSVVQQGTVAVEDGCGGEDVYRVGDAFEAVGNAFTGRRPVRNDSKSSTCSLHRRE
jgi:hypothetical protein